jgi:hypothetical protein
VVTFEYGLFFCQSLVFSSRTSILTFAIETAGAAKSFAIRWVSERLNLTAILTQMGITMKHYLLLLLTLIGDGPKGTGQKGKFTVQRRQRLVPHDLHSHAKSLFIGSKSEASARIKVWGRVQIGKTRDAMARVPIPRSAISAVAHGLHPYNPIRCLCSGPLNRPNPNQTPP